MRVATYLNGKEPADDNEPTKSAEDYPDRHPGDRL